MRGTSMSLLFLAAREVLELLDVDLLQIARLHVRQEEFAAVVQIVRLEAFLLRHGLGVAVLAVLGGHSGFLGVREQLGGRPGAGDGDEGKNDGCDGCSSRDAHGPPPRIVKPPARSVCRCFVRMLLDSMTDHNEYASASGRGLPTRQSLDQMPIARSRSS